MTEKTPGQLAYEASLISEGQPLQMLDGTDRWTLRTESVRGNWEYVAEFSRAPLLKEIAELRSESNRFQKELSMVRNQARKDNDRAEMADMYEKWLLEIGRVVGCSHLDERLPICIIDVIQGDK